jgi:poly(3-hydroxybutyrate) depolymerase
VLFGLSSFCIFTAAATTKISAAGNQQESIVDKPKEETVKAEPSSALSCMTRKQDNDNINPFAAGTAVWQRLMTYWLNAYGEFLKNAPK